MQNSPSTDEQLVAPPTPPRGLVIVAGYGPVGRVVCDLLESSGFEIHVIDINHRTTNKEHPHKRKFIFGDVRDPTVLVNAGIRKATALILGIPDEDQAVIACRVARELSPNIYIAARTNFVSKGLLATQAGADHVVIEEVVTAQAMKEAIVTHLIDVNRAD
jgi:CPA2 family monovalent cation:H+ antiporter-2